MFFLEKPCLFLFYVYPSLSNSGAAGGKYDKKDTSGVVAGDWLGAGGCPIKIAMVKPKISWYVCISSSYPQLFYLFQSHYIYTVYIHIYIYILSAYSYHISMFLFFFKPYYIVVLFGDWDCRHPIGFPATKPKDHIKLFSLMCIHKRIPTIPP